MKCQVMSKICKKKKKVKRVGKKNEGKLFNLFKKWKNKEII